MRSALLAMSLLVGLAAPGWSWTEPARGTETRSALMDALRPHAEWLLGAPVQFVVYDLRVAGDVAFASVAPQRPGGAPIDPRRAPAVLRGEFSLEEIDGTAIQALYRRSGRTWVAVHWVIGATDVWWSWPPLCARYAPVVPEVC